MLSSISPAKKSTLSSGSNSNYKSPGSLKKSSLNLASPPTSPAAATSANRTSTKDDSIRKQAERSLRRRSLKSAAAAAAGGGSISAPKKSYSLKHLPSSSISYSVVAPDISAIEVAQFMAAKRLDACLVGGSGKAIVGILTDKDLTSKIVADKQDPGLIKVKDIMTPNPTSTSPNTTVQEALEIMVRGRFRHLPIQSQEESKIPLGILDVTKCFNELLNKIDTIVNAGPDAAGQQSKLLTPLEAFFSNGSNNAPTVSTVLRTAPCPVLIPMRTTVLEATRLMKVYKRSAVITVDEYGKLKGIFTSKDVVLRVLAAGLDPATTSVVRVVTPNPTFVTPETPILDALKLMYEGHFLHLPVVDPTKNDQVIEVLDILELVTSVFHQMSELQQDKDSNNNYLWDQLWENNDGTQQSNSSFDRSSHDDYDDDTDIAALLEEAENIDPTILNQNIYTYHVDSPWGSISISGQGFDLATLFHQVCEGVKHDDDDDAVPGLFFIDKEGGKKLLQSDADLTRAHRESMAYAGSKMFQIALYLGEKTMADIAPSRSSKNKKKAKSNFVLKSGILVGSVGAVALAGFIVLKKQPEAIKNIFDTLKNAFN